MYKKTVFCLFWIFLTSCSLQGPRTVVLEKLKSGQYRIDPKHSSLIFKAGHMKLSTYVGRFNQFDAYLDFDPAKLEGNKLTGKITANSLDVNDSELEETLSKKTWFNSGQYPEILFETTDVKKVGENTFVFIGDLNLLGTIKETELMATFHGGARSFLTGKYTIGFSATASIKRSDFGMDSYLGIVADEVEIEIYAEFQKQ